MSIIAQFENSFNKRVEEMGELFVNRKRVDETEMSFYASFCAIGNRNVGIEERLENKYIEQY